MKRKRKKQILLKMINNHHLKFHNNKKQKILLKSISMINPFPKISVKKKRWSQTKSQMKPSLQIMTRLMIKNRT